MSVCSDTSDKWVRVMVFIATFNNISVILWRSVLLVLFYQENIVKFCSTRKTLLSSVLPGKHC
jgi:hypothetical protein